MTKERQIEETKKMDWRILETFGRKGYDYADEDILSNFKRLSGVVKALQLDISTPYGYAMFMTIMKIDRINNLLKDGKTPSNESLDDSFIDGVAYMKLAYFNYIDVKEGMVDFIKEDDLPF